MFLSGCWGQSNRRGAFSVMQNVIFPGCYCIGRTPELKGIFSRLAVTNLITGNKTRLRKYTSSVKFLKKQACRPGRGLNISLILGTKQRDGSAGALAGPRNHRAREGGSTLIPAWKWCLRSCAMCCLQGALECLRATSWFSGASTETKLLNAFRFDICL